MPTPEFTILKSGTIDICAGGIQFKGITLFINEAPILPFYVEVNDNSVSYVTEDRVITSAIRSCGDELILATSISNANGIHDAEPVGSASISGADHAYIQGFGMEGPSGYHLIDSELRRSHGIIGLAGDGCALAVFTTDHTRFRSQFSVRKSEQIYSENKTLTAGINLEGTVSGRIDLPEIHFIAGIDVADCMRRAAIRIAEEMHARTMAPPAFHWCSWYYHYENMSQEILEDLLDGLRDNPVDFRYIQLDAGYNSHMGDWMSWNSRYEAGLRKAANTIRYADYEAGIWIAPFMVGDKSDLYNEHPDWVIKNPDGSPRVIFRSYTEPKIWGNTDNDYYILDATNPAALDYLRQVFTYFRKMGFTLFKTDFILWSMADSSEVVRYDNSLTSVEILRMTYQMIREAIGEESYLLGSIAPFMPMIGYADGMRIAGDVGAQWSDKYGPENLLQELPYDNYFNNIFWQNDPDAVILRDFGTHLTDKETWSLALLQALSGGVITTSDPVNEISPERRELLDFIKPAYKVSADFPLLTEEREELVITHTLHDWNLFYVLNPTDHLLRIHYDLNGLFGTKAVFQYRFDWDDDQVVSEKSSCFSDTLAPHESALLFITEEPITAKPSNLWGRDTSYY